MSNDFLGHFADLQRLRRRKLTTLDIDSKTEIVEKRAPTDESVRLLAEMERAAEDKIVLAMRCTATEFSFTAHVIRDPATNPFEQRMRVRFTLGEKPYDFSVTIPDGIGQSKQEFMKHLRDAVAREIATRILQGSFMELVELYQFRP